MVKLHFDLKMTVYDVSCFDTKLKLNSVFKWNYKKINPMTNKIKFLDVKVTSPYSYEIYFDTFHIYKSIQYDIYCVIDKNHIFFIKRILY